MGMIRDLALRWLGIDELEARVSDIEKVSRLDAHFRHGLEVAKKERHEAEQRDDEEPREPRERKLRVVKPKKRDSGVPPNTWLG